MVRKSRGQRSKTRELLRIRHKKRTPITEKLKKFKIEEKVVIKINPSSQRGIPHPRYYGKSGKIVEKRGKSYIVEFKDGGKMKKAIAAPEHLKKLG